MIPTTKTRASSDDFLKSPVVRVAVVVPVYNALEWSERCILALLSINAGHDFDLFVQDDASPDARVWPALRRIAEQHPRIKLARNHNNEGFLGTCNHLFERLKREYDFIFLCNSDVIVSNNWLSSGLKLFAERSNCALVSYFATRGAQLTLLLPEGVSYEDTNEFLQKYDHKKPCRAVTSVGHLLGIRSSVVPPSQTLFDPVFGKGYGEESDLHYRMLAGGFEALVVPNVMVYHRGESSFGVISHKPHTGAFFERWGLAHEKAEWAEARSDSLSWLRSKETYQIKKELAKRLITFAGERLKSLRAEKRGCIVFVSSISLVDFLDELCIKILDLKEKYDDVCVILDKDVDLARRLPARLFFHGATGSDALSRYLRDLDKHTFDSYLDSEQSKSLLSAFSTRYGLKTKAATHFILEQPHPASSHKDRILVIAPDFILSGGIFVICDFISAMEDAGYDITVATPSGPLNHDNKKYGGRLCSLNYLRQNFGQPFDLFVFTWWESLFWGAKIPARRFLWIAQSIEEYFPSPSRPDERIRALAPYLLRGIEVVAISPWIRATLSTRFGTESHLIMNQLPADIQWEQVLSNRTWSEKLSPTDCSVVVEGSFTEYKNIPAAISLCDQLGFQRKTLVFAASPPSWEYIENLKKKGWLVYNNITRDNVIDVFKCNDILLRMSLLDSFGFAPLEMMATGGLVMVKHYQGAPGLCQNGNNSICFADEKDIERAFLQNKETAGKYFEQLALEGYSTSRRFMNSATLEYQSLVANLFRQPVDVMRSAALQTICEAFNVGTAVEPELHKVFTQLHEIQTEKEHSLSLKYTSYGGKPLRYRLADYIVLNGIKRLIPVGLYRSIKRHLES